MTHLEHHSIIGTDHTGFPGGGTTFLRDDGTFAAAGAAGSGQSMEALGHASPFANPSPGSQDDEFNATSISAPWVEVKHAGLTDNFIMKYGRLWNRIRQQGTSGDLHALLRPYTMANGDFIETAIWQNRIQATDAGIGLILADGTTFGAGTQMFMWFHSSAVRVSTGTNFTSSGSTNQGQAAPRNNIATNAGGPVFMRLQKVNSNTWAAFLSNDGGIADGWTQIGNNITPFAFTPTQIGVCYVNWDGLTLPMISSSWFYFRLNPANE